MVAPVILNCPLIVGMTGGIGCGKSTAAAAFQALGVPTLDADDLSRRLSAPDGAAYPAIVALFGDTIVNPDQTLDRARMRERVFHDAELRKKLEAILHPAIADHARRIIAEWRAPYGVWVAPLLLEAGSLNETIARVLVIDCPEEMQVARVMQTRGLPENIVHDIMRAQLSRHERLARADDVLDNSGTPAELIDGVGKLDRFYRELNPVV